MNEQVETQLRYYLERNNKESDYRRLAIQKIRDRMALISQDKESGGFDVKVCPDDYFLQDALERAFKDEGANAITAIEDVFYLLAVERWHARLWD